jgi:hypothetical protein
MSRNSEGLVTNLRSKVRQRVRDVDRMTSHFKHHDLEAILWIRYWGVYASHLMREREEWGLQRQSVIKYIEGLAEVATNTGAVNV